MLRDKMERRSYRKSPGRRYEYEYNPLNEQGRTDTSAPRDTWNEDEGARRPSRPGILAPRPDPRRTRQLTRQNILASRSQQEAERSEAPVQRHHHKRSPVAAPAPAHSGYYDPQPYREFEEEQIAEDWIKHGESGPDYMDPDLLEDEEDATEDPLEERVRYEPMLARQGARPTRKFTDPEDDSELLEAELAEKKKKATRRKFLLGAAAVTGTAVAAYEIVPRIPQAVNSGAANIEHQLQQAFQNGVQSGAEAARRDLLNALDDLEGVSLEGAIAAAKLTRIAYDVFVSPLVTLAANVADDFLNVTLQALITGRKWLAQINEDSPTLAALQTVLQSWVDQASAMPKKVQAITDSDLDGAQSYLRALQRKIQEEQAKLNNQTTPTATTHTTPTPKK